MDCTGYISTGSGQTLTPLYKITLEISGNDALVESLKDIFVDDFNLSDISDKLKSRLTDFEETLFGNKLAYTNGHQRVEIKFHVVNLLEKLNSGKLNNLITYLRTLIPEKSVLKLPLIRIKDTSLKVNFLTLEQFDKMFNGDNTSIEPRKGVVYEEQIYIRLSNDVRYSNYEMQIKKFIEYINDSLVGLKPHNTLFQDYLLTLLHETFHTLFLENSNYKNLIEQLNLYIEELKELGKNLPTQFKFLNKYLEVNNYSLFLEELLVYYNMGVPYFVEAISNIDFKQTIKEPSETEETKLETKDSDIQSAETIDFPEDNKLPFSLTNELGIIFPDYDFGGDRANLETFKQIAYAPYITFKPATLRTQLLSLKKHDIVYVKWKGDDGKEVTSTYIIEETKLSGENVIMRGRNINKLLPKDAKDESSDKLTTIVAEFAEQFKFKIGKSKLESTPIAFKKFTGMTRFIDQKGGIKPILEKGSLLKADVTRNATLWKLAVNNEGNSDGPQFIHFKNGSMKFDSRKDNVGMFIRIGGNETMTDIQTIAEPTHLGIASAGNQELLSDGTFNLLKIGDVVTYVANWSNNKPSYKTGIIVNKFGEGIIITSLENALADKYDITKDIPVLKKSLISAYIFFNKDSKVEENKSKILDDLEDFKKALLLLNVKGEHKPESYKALVKLGNKGVHDQNSFRKYENNQSFVLHEEPHYYYPGRKAIEVIYPVDPKTGERSVFPVPQFREFEKIFETLPYEAYKYLEDTSLVYPKSNPLNLKDNELAIIQNKNRNSYFLMLRLNKNRLTQSLRLRSGSVIALHGVKFAKTDTGWVKKDEKQFHYGIVVSRSKNQIGVAIPKKSFEEIDGKSVYTVVGWELVEVNITDYRPENKFEIIRIHNHIGFEKNLITVLNAVRTAAKLNYAKAKELPLDEQITEIESFVKNGQQEMLDNSKYLTEAKNLGSVWTRINFFSEYDFEDDNLTITGKDLDYRKANRDRYVSMLETGSIVMYRKYSKFLKKHMTKAYIVMGKDLSTGLPILVTTWESVSQYDENKENKEIINTFVPEIDKIVGVGLLNVSIETERSDLDGTPIKVRINLNEGFLEHQRDLIRKLDDRNKRTSYSDSAEDKVKMDELLKKNNDPEKLAKGKRPLVALQETVLEQVFDDPYGRMYSKQFVVLTMNYNAEKDKKYKHWTPVETRWGIYTDWGDHKYSKYYGDHFSIDFRKWTKGEKFSTASVPEGMKILEYIKQGTIIHVQPPGYKKSFQGIMLSKDERSIKLIKLPDTDADITQLTGEDIEYYDLWYRTADFGKTNQPEWRFVLPHVVKIEFTDYVDMTEFNKLKAIADKWKGKLPGDYNQVISRNIHEISIRETQRGIAMQQIRYSKGNNLTPIENIAELQKYLEKFKKLYGIKYELLSSKEIAERYDLVAGYANGLLSQFNAFKFGDTIVVNTDRASLSDVFHEMTHFVLEALKIDNPKLYLDLLSIIQNHPRYNITARAYPELKGNQLDEEVFSTLLGEIYSDKVKSTLETNWEEQNESTLARFFTWLRNLFGGNTEITNRELVNNSVRTVMHAFGSDLELGVFKVDLEIENNTPTVLTNKIEEMKKKLIDNGNLNMACQ